MLPVAHATGLSRKGYSERRGDLEYEVASPLSGESVSRIESVVYGRSCRERVSMNVGQANKA